MRPLPKSSDANSIVENAIGIFGGTFDPIHLGHINPAVEIAKQLNLQKIVLMPANIPPHKSEAHANSEQRLQMLKDVCTAHPEFQLDTRELVRQGKSFTFLSMQEFRAEHKDAKLFFFIGADSLLTLPTWFNINELLKLCHFVVSKRPGYDVEALDGSFYQGRLCTNVNDIGAALSGKILLLNSAQIDISSTQIRQRLQTNVDCQQYLLPQTLDYIKKQQLYR